MSIELFGKYVLFRQLGVGGMAEVHLAVDDEGRLDAVKRILPNQASNVEFARMFEDELNLAQRLQHRNIVNVVDHGEIADRKFIAMEYVHGRDLRTVIAQSLKAESFLPIDLAVFIVAETLEGLHHAHTATDDNGQRLNVVHRDVNPFNILVGFDGEVKLFDFGIAKADGAVVQQARQGQLKGKFGYLSPEQCSGQEVDARSDIFSTGTVLYEITVGARLFKESTDIKTLNAITEARVPRPTQRSADYPDDLEEIVLHALAKSPDDRYQTARHFADALRDWLDSNYPDAGQAKLREFMEETFSPEERERPEPPLDLSQGISIDDPMETEAAHEGGEPMSEQDKTDQSVENEGTEPKKSPEGGSTTADAPKAPTGEAKPDSAGGEASKMFGEDPELFDDSQIFTDPRESGLIDMSDFNKGRGRLYWFLAGFILLGTVIGIYIYRQKSKIADYESNKPKVPIKELKTEKPKPMREVTLTSTPTGATIWVDFQKTNGKTPLTLKLREGRHTAWVYSDGYLPLISSFTVDAKTRTFTVATLSKPGEKAVKGGVTLVPDPRMPDSAVYLADKKVSDEKMAVSGLYVGHPYVLELRAKERSTHVVLIWPSPRVDEPFGIKLLPYNESPAVYPFSVTTVPSGAFFKISDEKKNVRAGETNFTFPKLDVGASYRISLNYRTFPAIDVVFTMKLPFTLIRRFATAPKGKGKITVLTDPPSVVYVESPGNKEELGTTPILEKELPAGKYNLIFQVIIDEAKEQRELVPTKIPVTIEADKTLVEAYKYENKKLVKADPKTIKHKKPKKKKE
ncbi:MAG: serine/threonine protein kinase [Myxococcales bacterium]|nr:serine/threonine protein kinase [Myxococcales bacterium]